VTRLHDRARSKVAEAKSHSCSVRLYPFWRVCGSTGPAV